MKSLAAFLVLASALVIPSFPQESEGAGRSDPQPSVSESLPSPGSQAASPSGAGGSALTGAARGKKQAKLEPVFPKRPEGLLWVEAEDAITTNFSNQAVLDYGSSSYRRLQVNMDGQSKAAPFYAEYSFLVEEGGAWDLWIGGTPPGPKSDLIASFISPVRIKIDGGDSVAAYRENVIVTEQYSTNNYWFKHKDVFEFGPGVHTIRFEVAETRRYDSRFYFFLDCFFLVKRGKDLALGRGDRSALPESFPKDMQNLAIDNPFASIEAYEYQIQIKPKEKAFHLLLAEVYTLIGDHANAIKTLSRARILAGDDPRFTLLAAKNRIWSGESQEGLRLYREYLASPDAERSVWAEAGKMSAWLMQYRDADAIYREGIAKYPDDINLRANHALTLLWEGRIQEGERLLAELWERVKSDPEAIARLGKVFEISGYADKGIESYNEGRQAFPERLEFYTSLVRAYAKTNQTELAKTTLGEIADTFAQSDRLGAIIEGLVQESTMKSAALDRYVQRLQAEPDNLELRLELLRAYYWNGMLEEAMSEGYNILVNKLHPLMLAYDADMTDVFRQIDQLQSLRAAVRGLPTEAPKRLARLKKNYDSWQRAVTQEAQLRNHKDPAKRDQGLATLRSAEAAFARELAEAQAWAESVERLAGLVEAALEPGKQEEAALKEDKELLKGFTGWSWNTSSDLLFLDSRARAGNPLALHAFLRIGSVHQRPLPVAFSALSDPSSLREETAKVYSQARIWAGAPMPEDWDGLGYYDHGADLAALVQSVRPETVDPTAAALPLDPQAAYSELFTAIGGYKARFTALAQKMDVGIRLLYERLRTRLAIRMYQFDTETSQDRREIADIQLSLNRPADAVSNLRRVLMVASTDSFSQFTYGRALEMSGDWIGSMRTYREVYDLNPRFTSAISSYNRLARTHSRNLETSASLDLDTQQSRSLVAGSYAVPLLSRMDAKAEYRIEHRKIHDPQSSALPESLELHGLVLRFPARLGDGQEWRITPSVGGWLDNRLFNLIPADLGGFGLETLSSYAVVAPQLGADFAYRKDELSASAAWELGQVAETFLPDRDVYYEHKGRAELSWYQEEAGRDFGRVLAARLAGEASYRFRPGLAASEVWLWRADGELTVGNQVAEKPSARLDLGLLLSWQDSSDPENTAFYAPDSNLLFKGGPTLILTRAKAAEQNQVLSLRYWPGWLSTGGQDGLLHEGFIRFESINRGLSLYGFLAGMMTERMGTDPAYWSLSLSIGAVIRLGDYIIP